MRDTRYKWAYLFGAACPGRAAAAGLVLPFANTGAMNARLAEIARAVAPGAHAVPVLDGAGRHGAKRLVVPENISLLSLPPYAPELNPAANVRACRRASKLAITVFDSCDDIVDAGCPAWNFFADDPKAAASITARSWAEVNPQGRRYYSAACQLLVFSYFSPQNRCPPRIGSGAVILPEMLALAERLAPPGGWHSRFCTPPEHSAKTWD